MEKSKLSRLAKLIIGIVTTLIGAGLIVLAFFIKEKETNTKWYSAIAIAGALVTFIGVMFIYQSFAKKHIFTVKEVTMIGVQSALTIIFYYIASYIPKVPFFPPWLDLFNMSELPALITTFAYGPYAGCIVIFVRFLTKLPGTFTVGVGEFADLLLGLSLVIITGMIYKKHHSLKGALVGSAIAMCFCTLIACVLNWLVLIPAYIKIAGFSMEYLTGALSYMGNVTPENFMIYYILIGVLPFNLLRYLILFLLTFLLYKRIHKLLNKITAEKEKELSEKAQ